MREQGHKCRNGLVGFADLSEEVEKGRVGEGRLMGCFGQQELNVVQSVGGVFSHLDVEFLTEVVDLRVSLQGVGFGVPFVS